MKLKPGYWTLQIRMVMYHTHTREEMYCPTHNFGKWTIPMTEWLKKLRSGIETLAIFSNIPFEAYEGNE